MNTFKCLRIKRKKTTPTAKITQWKTLYSWKSTAVFCICSCPVIFREVDLVFFKDNGAVKSQSMRESRMLYANLVAPNIWKLANFSR